MPKSVPARAKKRVDSTPQAEAYQHHDETVLRPEAGTQAQFKKRRSPKKYRYDSALSPALEWDGQNGARELGDWLIAEIGKAVALPAPHKFPQPHRYGEVVVAGLKDGLAELRKLSRPFLNWAGKAERLSFDVPTLPLFVHERLSTKAILETLKAHERDRQMELQLFGDPQLSLAQQLEAYEHTGGWVNRLILGDSLVVMNSLLEYEGLGGRVQMMYIDPPYGVKFGSNFQPFVRKRDVTDGSDDDMTREPEMVKAYRDTWELGLHSYLTYLRDRLLIARDLLSTTGSVFVQIGSQNVHHAREVMDEVFGSENFVTSISFIKANAQTGLLLESNDDYLIWYARDRQRAKYHPPLVPKAQLRGGGAAYRFVELADGTRRPMTKQERSNPDALPPGSRIFRADKLMSSHPPGSFPVEFEGRTWLPKRGFWSTGPEGMERLKQAKRLIGLGDTLSYVRFIDDFPAFPVGSQWSDTITSGFTADKLYAVQTNTKVVQRCLLMTTDPGDLVLDPTCGSGTTAYVAEQWGRRWITLDISRVPLALTRQRLLSATYQYYDLQDKARGPVGGFVYRRRQNRKGEEVGGIVPHVTLESIAKNEPAKEEILVDHPEVDGKVTRVTGPFCVEATIPTPLGSHLDRNADAENGGFTDRLLEALRHNPVLQLAGNRTITLENVRRPAKTLTISAEAGLEGNGKTVALVFGPENGPISDRLVYEAAREAYARSYSQLLVIGFAIEAVARDLVDKSADLIGIPASYVQATPDLVMGDLLKTMRSSQIFSVTGLPDVAVKRLKPEEKRGPHRYQVELRGLDTFDPVEMKAQHRAGNDVPAWFLDTDYNELCFHVSQAFFPRTSAWENLKTALRGAFEDSVWEHLAGTTSTPFLAGERRKVAVKVIDDRGNELLVVKSLDEAM